MHRLKQRSSFAIAGRANSQRGAFRLSSPRVFVRKVSSPPKPDNTAPQQRTNLHYTNKYVGLTDGELSVTSTAVPLLRLESGPLCTEPTSTRREKIFLKAANSFVVNEYPRRLKTCSKAARQGLKLSPQLAAQEYGLPQAPTVRLGVKALQISTRWLYTQRKKQRSRQIGAANL